MIGPRPRDDLALAIDHFERHLRDRLAVRPDDAARCANLDRQREINGCHRAGGNLRIDRIGIDHQINGQIVCLQPHRVNALWHSRKPITAILFHLAEGLAIDDDLRALEVFFIKLNAVGHGNLSRKPTQPRVCCLPWCSGKCPIGQA